MPNKKEDKSNYNIIEMYSIYDKQTDIYDTPFFTKTAVNAHRHFIMVARQERSVIRNFIDDYELHYIGTFDVKTGITYPVEIPVQVLTGMDLLSKDFFDGENAFTLPEEK